MGATAAAAASAAVAQARRRIVEQLRSQGATSAETEVALLTPRPLDQRVLARLLREGSVVQGGPDRYHLDEVKLAEARARQRRVGLIALGVAAVAALIAIGIAIFMR